MAEDLQPKIAALKKEIEEIKEQTRTNRELKDDTTSLRLYIK